MRFGKKKKKGMGIGSKYAREHSVGDEIIKPVNLTHGIGVTSGGPGIRYAPKGKFMKGRRNEEIKAKKGDFSSLVSARFKGFGEMKAGAYGKLMAMTARDFGDDRAAWEDFYAQNKHLEINDWRKSGLAEAGYAIEGLEDRDLIRQLIETLVDEKRHVREGGYAMLKELAGPAAPYMPNGSVKMISNGYSKWVEWFEK